jgi:hypothetical protein
VLLGAAMSPLLDIEQIEVVGAATPEHARDPTRSDSPWATRSHFPDRRRPAGSTTCRGCAGELDRTADAS